MTNTRVPESDQKFGDVLNARPQATFNSDQVDVLLTLARARWEAGWADGALELLESIAASGADGEARASQLRGAIWSERAAFQRYLCDGLAARGVSSQVVERAQDVWAWLAASFAHLPLPSVGPRAHGGADLTWRIAGWDVEIELLTGDEQADSGWWMSGPQRGGSKAGSLDDREAMLACFAEFLGSVIRHAS